MKISKSRYNRNVIGKPYRSRGKVTITACKFPILLQVVLLEQGYRVNLRVTKDNLRLECCRRTTDERLNEKV